MNEEYYMEKIKNVSYHFSDAYGITFIDFETFEILRNCLDGLRDLGVLKTGEYTSILNMWRTLYKKYFKVKELDSIQPRVMAQKFIGKKSVRKFIFDRDKICLCCGSSEKLSIDHIIPISKGGMNILENLQLLCMPCNIRKRDKTIDYRNIYNG